MKKNLLILAFTTLALSPVFAQDATATYTIEFLSNWEAHGPLPGNSAHFTELVGTTHNDQISFYEVGETASSAIEEVAEAGRFGQFKTLVENEASRQNARNGNFIQGPALYPNRTNLQTITIENVVVSSKFPLLTLASMIAPSPDWMIGVSGLNLMENGEWRNSVELDLFPLDGGSEEGTEYDLDNDETTPKEAIRSIRGEYKFNNQKIGTLRITRTDKTLSNSDFDPKTKVSVLYNASDNQIVLTNHSQHQIDKIEIYNALGAQVYRGRPYNRTNTSRINTSSFRKGVYILKLYSGNSSIETAKVILN